MRENAELACDVWCGRPKPLEWRLFMILQELMTHRVPRGGLMLISLMAFVALPGVSRGQGDGAKGPVPGDEVEVIAEAPARGAPKAEHKGGTTAAADLDARIRRVEATLRELQAAVQILRAAQSAQMRIAEEPVESRTPEAATQTIDDGQFDWRRSPQAVRTTATFSFVRESSILLPYGSVIRVMAGGKKIPRAHSEDPSVAELNAISPVQVELHAKRSGNTTIRLWDTNGAEHRLNISVGDYPASDSHPHASGAIHDTETNLQTITR
ncbi:MAG: pilus assembly protein N-terminal domain-containing protein, partial [Candidatus Saccharimonadales bacterium]